MAIAAALRLCGNCKKDIPAANFITHEIHCRRNIEVCRFCSDSVPKDEMQKHVEAEHVQVTCKCRMKMENSLLKDHEASACPLRPALCQYCDIPLAFNRLLEHEVYCGARTEMCGGCGRNVLLKELKEHPRVCGQEEKGVRGSRARPRCGDEDGDLLALRDVRTWLRSEGEEQHLETNRPPRSSPPDEWNADLDYVLALSLQHESNPRRSTAADCWESYCTKESVSSARRSGADKSTFFFPDSLGSFSTSSRITNDEVTMLPCEFCEELYPAEDLILHQTGCNPASAFASFSKSSPSPDSGGYDGPRALGSRSCRSRSSSQPQAVQAEGNITLPCEFCGVQLEEEMLFHHQHHCDLRPDSPTANLSPPLLWSPQANTERRESPELPRRRSRHQEDVSPRCAGDFGQRRLSCPTPETELLSDTADTRNSLLRSPAGTGAAPDPQGKPRKAPGNKGWQKNRGGFAGGATPRARPQNFPSTTFTSGFVRAAPTQPSSRGGRGRSLELADGPSSCSSTQVKSPSPAPGPAEEK